MELLRPAFLEMIDGSIKKHLLLGSCTRPAPPSPCLDGRGATSPPWGGPQCLPLAPQFQFLCPHKLSLLDVSTNSFPLRLSHIRNICTFHHQLFPIFPSLTFTVQTYPYTVLYLHTPLLHLYHAHSCCGYPIH